MNYAQLQSNIADFLNRSDLSAVIPTFIGLAESQMERALRVRQMVARSEGQIDSQYSGIPPDFLEVKTLKVTSARPVQPVEFVTPEQMDGLDRISASAPGLPKYFTIIGNNIRLSPTPDATYLVELVYFTQIPSLSNTVTTNWLLKSSPDAYLYGALMQAAPYLKDDERVGVWGTLYNTAIEAIKTADQNASSSGLVKARVKPFGAR